ncbi:MAG TPA: alginate lyase family protein [Candidatus Didemnitutus sp.]|nr:alginate lyase family protein [Candidatus Didemnitutus sp.]
MKAIFLRRVRQVRQAGLKRIIRVVIERMGRAGRGGLLRVLAQMVPTGLSTWSVEQQPVRLAPNFARRQTPGTVDVWKAHIFDLLGSGPQPVKATMNDLATDLPRAWGRHRRKLAALLPHDYMPIDWRLDGRSGHRWSGRSWSKSIAYGHQRGVEIKWPWELARLQHLPAMASQLSCCDSGERRSWEAEIRAQIIDFVMHNPPGYGVNWICAMDVGIRAANLALAVDLARAAGAVYDDAFLRLISATLRDHGRHLVRNLEWGASLCSNHYLANIVGLLFVAASLPADRESADWLTFAGREFVAQLRFQFHPDGTNFEASTCYHRLSSEMMVYAAALMLSLARTRPAEVAGWWSGRARSFHPAPAAEVVPFRRDETGKRLPFADPDIRRIAGAGLFTAALLRRDGTVPLVGDDDSGRFMRMEYESHAKTDLLSHAHLPAAIAALFAAPSDFDWGDTAEARWLREWVGHAALPVPAGLPNPRARFQAFPEFGLYLWNRGPMRLTLRCGPVGQKGNGGHAHADQLSITLDLDGVPRIIDPGTGLYTPDPDTRNRLRSSTAHATVVVPGCEPNAWLPGGQGLFAMEDTTRGTMIRADESGAVALHQGFGAATTRRLSFVPNGILIEDTVSDPSCAFHAVLIVPESSFRSISASDIVLDSGPPLLVRCAPGGSIAVEAFLASPAYGRFERSSRLIIRAPDGRFWLEFLEEK